MQRSLDSISSVQSEVQEYPKLRSLLKTFMDDQGSVPHNPYDIHVRGEGSLKIQLTIFTMIVQKM